MYEDLAPIPINPGGTFDPANVVGRDEDLAVILTALERGGGLVLTGERRHGKTSLSRLVEKRARERGWTVVARSVEGKKSVQSVCETLAADLLAVLPGMRRTTAWLRSRADVKLGPVSVDGIVTAAVESADDPWDLKHYVTRLPDYYGEDAAGAGTILVLVATQPADLATIRAGLATAAPEVANAGDIVGRLEQDHYLVRENGTLRLRSVLVRRAWLRWRA